jgi:hypothetical protein
MEFLFSEDEINSYSNQVYRKILSSVRPTPFRFLTTRKLSDHFPRQVIAYMGDFLEDDLNEMGFCVEHSLWTAAAMMAFRIFEDSVMVHVSEDLKKSTSQLNLKRAIDQLNKTFTKQFVKQLHSLRKLRNEGMHPEKRFEPNETLEIIGLVIIVVMHVYGIKPESS